MDYDKNPASEQMGHIEIADEVIATMVKVSTLEVEGVAGLAPRSYADQAIMGIMGKKNAPTVGVKVDVNGSEVSVDINILVTLGAKVQEVASNVQSRVKNTIESMAGLSVRKVNVFVSGIDEKNAEKSDAAEE